MHILFIHFYLSQDIKTLLIRKDGLLTKFDSYRKHDVDRKYAGNLFFISDFVFTFVSLFCHFVLSIFSVYIMLYCIIMTQVVLLALAIFGICYLILYTVPDRSFFF